MRGWMIWALLLLVGCSREQPIVQRGACYWKTRIAWSADDVKRAHALGVTRIYCRYFDVAWVDSAARPVAPVQGLAQFDSSVEIIPAVYITLAALQAVPNDSLSTLAYRIVAMVRRMHAPGTRVSHELLIDCDWTAKTRDKYFQLLQEIGKVHGQTLAATIRLHQVLFAAKMGVPPVQRGMLMFYNMGHPGKMGTRNSIIDPELVDTYTRNLSDYGLPLDYAFPTFSWGVLFRKGEMIGLLRDLSIGDLRSSALLEHDNGAFWNVLRSGVFAGVHLRSGDRIRLDDSEPATVQEVAQLVASRARYDSTTTVLFFSWEATQSDAFPYNDIGGIYEHFH